ncbi:MULTISPECIES: DUF7680 family protein [Cylindrospermopsis]|jgi:hypothetical protein|uniref:DUF7680 family protein n=1 Tax=Cylindrospermopsis TaxID=77021 RepID=UPI000B60EBC8|nr:hypothetical protein [Cylindrospermopsis curvispora]BAZ91524.1 hypothetical protein NIES932_30360 [Raphidiopsis curvata NIES-932]
MTTSISPLVQLRNHTDNLPQFLSKPHYQLQVEKHSGSDLSLEIYQLPAPATPHLKHPRRIAGLKGRNLALIENRLLRQLKFINIDLPNMQRGKKKEFEIDEENALRMGLMFRVLAPMRNRENMCCCAEGIEAMGKEEAAYWLGMAMHRKNPRRVLMALRCLLTDPNK